MRQGIAVLLVVGFFLGFIGISTADDWPEWQGPNRDGKSAETGLLKSWPEAGPKLLCTITGLGEGFSQPAVVGDKIYVTGKVEGDLVLYCCDVSGNKLWEDKVGPAFAGDRPGARGTPTVEKDRLYLMTCAGLVASYDLNTHKKAWEVNIVDVFGGKLPNWGYAESVLIDGDKLICTPGGSKALMAALNKNTGETLWTIPGGEEGAAYSSAIVFEFGGVRQYSVMTAKSMIGVNSKDGSVLWRYDRPIAKITCATPLFSDGVAFGFTGYGNGGGAAKLVAKDGIFEASQIWETKDLKAHHGGYVLVDGFIYGNNDKEGWTCLDPATGAVKYKELGVGKGSITYADGMLYTLGENGKMGLVAATPTGHKLVGEFMIPNAGDKSWAHPVISNGKLFLRRHEQLHVYDVKAETK